jgi:hypothetical protein
VLGYLSFPFKGNTKQPEIASKGQLPVRTLEMTGTSNPGRRDSKGNHVSVIDFCQNPPQNSWKKLWEVEQASENNNMFIV